MHTSRLMMLVATLGLAVSMAAGCEIKGPTETQGYLTQSEPCQQCQKLLVDCSSSSKNETQFVGCRDQFQACQQQSGLGPNECTNPNDADACALCRGRHKECNKQGLASCDQEFGVCKAFLLERADLIQSCDQSADVSADVACGVCRKDLAACVSDATGTNTSATCNNKYENCKVANLIETACPMPSDQEGCVLCEERLQGCMAAGGDDSCNAHYDACINTIAPNGACKVNTVPNDGSGGGGGQAPAPGTGGGGEGGGTTTACEHSECSEGAKLDASCSECAQLVCQKDNYCCDTEWDNLCVTEAQNSCGCS